MPEGGLYKPWSPLGALVFRLDFENIRAPVGALKFPCKNMVRAGPRLIFSGQKGLSRASQNPKNNFKTIFGGFSPSRNQNLGLWDSHRIFEIADDENVSISRRRLGFALASPAQSPCLKKVAI